VNVDDIVETANHFRCIDLVIEQANQPLSETFIKGLHLTLVNGTSNARKNWFAVRLQEASKRSRRAGHRIAERSYRPHEGVAPFLSRRERKDVGGNHFIMSSSLFTPSRTATRAWAGLFFSRNACGTTLYRSSLMTI